MSDNKECNWCKLDNPPSSGRWRDGSWICYTCLPAHSGFIKATRCCDMCGNKVSQVTIVKNFHYCAGCCGNPNNKYLHKKNNKKKKKKKHWHVPVLFPKQKNQPINQKHKNQEVKIERWKILIVDISNGKL